MKVDIFIRIWSIEVGKNLLTERTRRLYLTYAGGLIAIDVVVMGAFIAAAFITAGSLDFYAQISVILTALAFPMLVCCLLSLNFTNQELLGTARIVSLLLVGSIATFWAIFFALYHVSWIASVLFFISAIVAAVIMPPLKNID